MSGSRLVPGWLAWLIGPAVLAGPLLDLRRARLALGTTAAFLAILAFGLLQQARYASAGDPVTAVLWASAAGTLGVLVLVRLGRTRLAAHYLLGNTLIFIAATLWFREGAPVQLFYFSALVPMSAAFLLGSRETFLWGGVSVGLICATWGLTAAGVLEADAALLERTLAARFPAAILFQVGFVLAAGFAARVRNATLRQAVESQESYQGLFDHSPLGVAYLDLEGKVISVNDRLVEILGGSEPNEIVGQALEKNRVAGFPELRKAVEECLSTGSITTTEAKWTSTWGRPVHIHVHLAPVRDRQGQVLGVQAVSEDITERSRTEGALRESEARYRAIIENSSAMIAEVNGESVHLMGDLVEETLGLAPGEYGFEAMMERVHPDDQERVRTGWIDAISGGRTEGTPYRHRGRDGDWRWLDSSVRVFQAGDGSQRLSIATRDITERIRMEEQMRHSQKMQALGQLAGGIAHDFNNLLTVITGSAGMLRGATPSQVQETAAQILDAARRGAALTQQLLAFGRGVPPSLQVCDLNRLIKRLDPMLRRSLAEDVAVELELTPGIPWARVEPNLLEQALLNLVLNARDALSHTGTIRIRTRNQSAASVGESAGDSSWVAIDVCDDGPGMPAEVAEHVFEPFFTTKSEGKGSGLGLAMVYGTITRMGGSVSVESSPGSGTVFTLCFPGAAAETAEVSEAPRAGLAAPGSGRVLVVEDDAAVRRVTMGVLARAGYDVLAAENAAEALSLAEQEDGSLDLVLSDVVMPGRSGPELALALRERWPNIPVLLVTGHPLDHVGSLDGFPQENLLQKPFTPKSLTGAVRALLSQS